MSNPTERAKEVYLRFLTSELTSHASNMIGFSVILFAYLNVLSRFFEPIPFLVEFYPTWSTAQYFLIFLILSVINTAIIFPLFRLIFYGKLAHETITYEGSANSLRDLARKTTDVIKQKTFFKGLIRLEWFSTGISEMPLGFWFSFAVGMVGSVFLIFTFLFYLV